MTARIDDDGRLHGELVLDYPYDRTIGPIIGRFLTGLRDKKVFGVKGSDGQVLVPPPDYDPRTSEDLSELVEVGQSGEVISWTWVREPVEGNPLDGTPFAWGLIRLDGADTPFLHAIRADGPSSMSTGMRVTAQWRNEREGHVKDIECFVPEAAS